MPVVSNPTHNRTMGIVKSAYSFRTKECSYKYLGRILGNFVVRFYQIAPSN